MLDQPIEWLDSKLAVSTLLGGGSISNSVVKACPISIVDREFLVDLIMLDMQGLYVILGIDWLAAYHATLDYFGKRIIFQILR